MAVKHMYDYIGYFTEEGRAEGREQGLAKGRQEERALWISSLLAQGKLSHQDIADAMGFPLSYVEAFSIENPDSQNPRGIPPTSYS